MILPEILQMLLTASAMGSSSDSDIEFDPVLAAILLRYESITNDKKNELINAHLAPIQNKNQLFKAISSYDGDYLLSLSLSYSGITELCSGLVNLCTRMKVTCPQIWKDYANGNFNWQEDIDSLSRTF